MQHNNRHDPAMSSLGRYWDEVLRNRPAAPDDLDPALAETVRQLHARDDAPGADAAFATRLLAQLEDHMNTMKLDLPRLDDPLAASDRSRRTAPWVPIPAWSPRRRLAWPLAQLASAALVMITLAVAYLAFGPPRPGGQDNQLTGVPAAIVALATPSPSAAANETLAVITLPAGAIPAEIVAGMNHYSVPAGSEGVWDWDCCTGARLSYILEGTYTVRGTGAIQVQRAGNAGVWEEIAAGTEIVLEPGDALLSRMEDTFEGVNSGTTAVELLDAVLFAGEPIDDPVPYTDAGVASWAYQDQDIWLLPIAVPPEPVTLRMLQSSLDPGADLPPPAGAILQLAVDRDVEGVVSTQVDFTMNNPGVNPVTLYAVTLQPASAEGGTPAAMP